MKRLFAKYWRPVAAILAIMVISGAVSLVILTNQRLRIPFINPQPIVMKAEFSNSQAVTPGQGQTVQISGVEIGLIGAVELKEGRAIADLEIEPRFKGIIRKDARAALRPRTGLKDMYIQVYPGSKSAPKAKAGFEIPVSRTLTDVDLDEVLASLDADTRDYLQLFINGAGTGLRGRGQDLAEVFRRFEPTVRDLARVNKAVAQEKEALKTTINSLAVITKELNRRPEELTTLVDSSAAVFEAFAAEDQALRSSVRELPATLRQASTTLRDIRPFARQLRPTTRRLLPAIRELEDFGEVLRPAAREMTPTIREEIRPFVREVRPLVRDLRPAAEGLNRTTPNLTRSLTFVNRFFNMLGYNKNGREDPNKRDRDEGYLFSLAWATHQGVNLINIDDANGPMRPIFLTGTCSTLVELVAGRPEAEFGFGLTPLLSTICGDPQTPSIDLPLARKTTKAVEKAQRRAAAKDGKR